MNAEHWKRRVADSVAHRRAGGRRRYNREKQRQIAARRGMIRRALQEARSIDGLIIITTIPTDAVLPQGLVDYLSRVTKLSKSTIRRDIRAIRGKSTVR